MVEVVRRFDVWLAALDPALGHEIRKTRPVVVLSPDEMNRHLETVVVAPLTSVRRAWPFRPDTEFDGIAGQLALDQMRALDRIRLQKRLGEISPAEGEAALAVLREMFEA